MSCYCTDRTKWDAQHSTSHEVDFERVGQRRTTSWTTAAELLGAEAHSATSVSCTGIQFSDTHRVVIFILFTWTHASQVAAARFTTSPDLHAMQNLPCEAGISPSPHGTHAFPSADALPSLPQHRGTHSRMCECTTSPPLGSSRAARTLAHTRTRHAQVCALTGTRCTACAG